MKPSEKPIIFNTEMVRAILDGRKTKTRRVIKVRGFEWIQEDKFVHVEHPKEGISEIWWDVIRGGPTCVDQDYDYMKCPYGKPGDILYVRETFFPIDDKVLPQWAYKADYRDDFNWHNLKWKPSIFMPKEASRIWLRVKNVRVERVQEISEEDAIAEGVKSTAEITPDGSDYTGLYASEWFWQLWDSINGKRDGGIYSWDSNPWVWVVEFEAVSTTGRLV